MVTFKFIVTRQLTAYSGSDKYLNLNSIDEIHKLYNGILDGSISTVNSQDVEAIESRTMVKLNIEDKILQKKFPIHIKKSHDGLRFTITEYVNQIKMSPNSILIISLDIQTNGVILLIKIEYFYKYILEKHSSENIYRILIENPPTDRIGTTDFTDSYLKKFNIINSHNNDLNWRGSQRFNGYICEEFTKKYIGVPYVDKEGIFCDEFDSIEEIL
jgi:hypothetical protein